MMPPAFAINVGTEALFADVGHFTVTSIQISMCSITYPALIIAYTGQASYLRKHNDQVLQTFYKSIPGIYNQYNFLNMIYFKILLVNVYFYN